MKRAALLFLLLCAALLCIGCAPLQQALEQQLNTANTVVIAAVQPQTEFSGLDTAALEKAAENSTYTYQLLSAESESQQYEALCAAAAEPSTAVLVADLSSRAYAPLIVRLAQKYGLPLILCGVQPSAQTLAEYDNCWYVGFDPALAAEQQAGLLIQAFRNGLVTDQNGDYKQSCLCVGSLATLANQQSGYASKLLQALEIGGIHVAAAADMVTAADAETLAQRLDALLLPQTQAETIEEETADGEIFTQLEEALAPAAAQTELFICGDVMATESVLQTVAALHAAASEEALAGLATPEQTYTVIGFGCSDAIDAALADGTLLGTVTQDTAAAAQAVYAICENLLRHESPTGDTDYHLNDNRSLMLNYQVLTADIKEPT